MAINVETVGGSTGTSTTAFDRYFYDSFDYESAKVDVTYKATGYTKESNLLWFYLSSDEGDSEDTPFAYASLNDPSRTDIVDMSQYTTSQLQTIFTNQGNSTIFATASGTDTFTLTWSLSEDPTKIDVNVPFFVAERQDQATPALKDAGFKLIRLFVPSYIKINQTTDGTALYDGYRVAAGTTLTITAQSSQDFDVTCPDPGGFLDGAGLIWSVIRNGVESVVASCEAEMTYTFGQAGTSYTVKARGEGFNGTAEDSITISTVTNPGLCDQAQPGYIRNDRVQSLGNKISIGDLAGNASRSINQFADYVQGGGAGNTKVAKGAPNSKLGTRRNTIVNSGKAQGIAALADDNVGGGLRFSEFFDAQSISGEVSFTGETPDRYGYFTTSNGVITVTVNCNTTQSNTVSVSVQGARMGSPSTQSKTVTNTGNNQFTFSGLDTRSDSGSATENWKVTILDTGSGESAFVNLPNPGSGDGYVTGATIGAIFR